MCSVSNRIPGTASSIFLTWILEQRRIGGLCQHSILIQGCPAGGLRNLLLCCWCTMLPPSLHGAWLQNACVCASTALTQEDSAGGFTQLWGSQLIYMSPPLIWDCSGQLLYIIETFPYRHPFPGISSKKGYWNNWRRWQGSKYCLIPWHSIHSLKLLF